jgi:hypothetical protein
VQPEKPAPSLASTDLVMSRAKVERRSVADVDSGHDLLVGNGGVGSTSGTRHGATRRSEHGGDGARRSGRRGVARRGMGVPPQGGLGWADGEVSRDERSEEVRISVAVAM